MTCLAGHAFMHVFASTRHESRGMAGETAFVPLVTLLHQRLKRLRVMRHFPVSVQFKVTPLAHHMSEIAIPSFFHLRLRHAFSIAMTDDVLDMLRRLFYLGSQLSIVRNGVGEHHPLRSQLRLSGCGIDGYIDESDPLSLVSGAHHESALDTIQILGTPRIMPHQP